jgi:hypothetical protein
MNKAQVAAVALGGVAAYSLYYGAYRLDMDSFMGFWMPLAVIAFVVFF